MKLAIAGAGLTGLLAAHAWPTAPVFEASAAPRAAHRALLRFRSDAVAKLTGIDFEQLTVRKGIYNNGAFVAPDIRLANAYAQKVTGQLVGERSIWSLEPVQRFIAPETFYEQLIEAIGGRIQWGCSVALPQGKNGDGPLAVPIHSDFTIKNPNNPLISTIPLPDLLKELAVETTTPFNRSGIHVARYRLDERTRLNQTIYFPTPQHPLYRASITGSLLIAESIAAAGPGWTDPDTQLNEPQFCAHVFGLRHAPVLIDEVDQKYGKIVPLPAEERKALLHRLTRDHNIFSLGRFATWRNILLDDVVADIQVVRRLLRASGYDRSLFAS